MNTSTPEESHVRWFYIGIAACLITGALLGGLCVKAMLDLLSDPSRAPRVVASGLLLSLILQWAILTVLVMILLDPKRRVG